ncbi:ANR family transcriptional regulator [Aeromonas salmonicida]|uniref:ANR family transcriptional regulator n=1 Tax=Aeromonas salmonicida TaxID=645 RepID=UPI0031FCDD87
MINAALKGDQLTRQIENKPNGYMALATRAAEFEREGRVASARPVDHARKAAKNALNRQWATVRADLCMTCIHRFGKREA